VRASLESLVFDPQTLPVVSEIEAHRLASQHELVSVGMARHALRKGCKYFLKVRSEYAKQAGVDIINWYGDISMPGVVYYADGKIFLSDEELYTILKMLYS